MVTSAPMRARLTAVSFPIPVFPPGDDGDLAAHVWVRRGSPCVPRPRRPRTWRARLPRVTRVSRCPTSLPLGHVQGQGVERGVNRLGGRSLDHPVAVPVHPPAGREAHLALDSPLPDRRGQQVLAEHPLVPAVERPLLVGVGEDQRSDDRETGLVRLVSQPLEVVPERVVQSDIPAVDVDHLGVVGRFRVHGPGEARPVAVEAHEGLTAPTWIQRARGRGR